LPGNTSLRQRQAYDNGKAESFMKTLKVEAVYLMAYETFEDVTAEPQPRSLLSMARLNIANSRARLSI
jgi:hypothetical protein